MRNEPSEAPEEAGGISCITVLWPSCFLMHDLCCSSPKLFGWNIFFGADLQWRGSGYINKKITWFQVAVNSTDFHGTKALGGSLPALLREVISNVVEYSVPSAQITAESTVETLPGKEIRVESLNFLANTCLLVKGILCWHSCIHMTFVGVEMSWKMVSLRSIAVQSKLLSITQSWR